MSGHAYEAKRNTAHLPAAILVVPGYVARQAFGPSPGFVSNRSCADSDPDHGRLPPREVLCRDATNEFLKLLCIRTSMDAFLRKLVKEDRRADGARFEDAQGDLLSVSGQVAPSWLHCLEDTTVWGTALQWADVADAVIGFSFLTWISS